MSRVSAGLIMYRATNGILQILLAHPGGPVFKKRDLDTWTIPKGEVDRGEDLLSTALREFEEDTGLKPQPPFVPLKPIQPKGGKIVHAWAFAGDCDPTAIKSNLVTMEWPAGSGHMIQFPEVDRAEFFDLDTVRKKIKAAQAPLLDELEELLNSRRRSEAIS